MSTRIPLRSALLVAALPFLLAPAAASARTRHEVGDAPVIVGGKVHLPAWRTEWEKHLRLQKDSEAQLDAFRTAHPEYYGATAPPAAPVTFYPEFGPVDSVLYTWDSDWYEPFYLELTHQILTASDATPMILHHGSAKRDELIATITAAGDDPGRITWVDVSTLGPYYQYQNDWPLYPSIDSVWTIDYGPWWVADADGVLSIVDFRYYPERINDDALPAKLGALWGVDVYRPDLAYEGGNFFSDGQGTCYGTAMHLAYNAVYSQAEVEQQLHDYLGCTKMIWLWPALGEGTGHIDMFWKLASPTVMILGEFDPALDLGNAEIMERNAEILASETNAAGDPLEVLRVPMPASPDGVFRTYTNGILVNDLVLVPVYPQHADLEAEALAVFAQAFPGKAVVGIDAEDIIPDGGAIHCVTRTRPRGSLTQMETPPAYACDGDAVCESGCGDVTGTGECFFGVTLFCDAGGLWVEACYYQGQRCGWDLDADYFYCVPAGCGTLAPEGECRTTADGDFAVTCDADGYPQATGCAAGEECAVIASTGQVGCRAPCTDDCTLGDVGCDEDGVPITCGEAGDGDDCAEILTGTPCAGDETCQGGTCACADECPADLRICGVGNVVRTCGQTDADACLDLIETPCAEGTTCRDGTCIAAPEPGDGGGCDCATGGAGAPALLPLGLLLLGWLRRRR